MSAKIGIIDYQMGNLRSVQKAFEKGGYEAEIFSEPGRFAEFEKIVLPGVGAFRDAIGELKNRDLVSPIRDWVAADKPFLGICLGLQLLFDRSFEDGEYEGLGIIEGEVVKFEIAPELKVPHMGWNTVTRSAQFQEFNAIRDNAHFYFVHSYYVQPAYVDDIALTSNYGLEFCAAVSRGNLLATQFHPEKSQQDGLSLLKQFAEKETVSIG